MARIKLLDETVSSRIAAGEVVERPASIVKELIENSIDAGATSVSVIIQDGGISSIRVSDNGVGIEKEDLPLTIVKHATSKISNVDDLDRIFSMGFRGEALFSVATVSELSISSRVKHADSGYCLTAKEGKILDIEPKAIGEGTTVISKNLFYNTPARLKFLSTPAQEAAQVSAMVARLILAYPNVSIKYTSGEKTLYHSPGTGVQDAILSVFGMDRRDKLMQIEANVADSGVYGFVSKPPLFEKSSKYKFAYVNNRAVDAAFMSKIVSSAYGQRILKGEYPFFCLYFTLPYEDVDVNVHPNKLTVRFAKDLPTHLVMQAVSDGIAKLASPKFTLGSSENKKLNVKQEIAAVRELLEFDEVKSDSVVTDYDPTSLAKSTDEKQLFAKTDINNSQNDKILRRIEHENSDLEGNLSVGKSLREHDKKAHTPTEEDLQNVRNLMMSIRESSNTMTLHQYAPRQKISEVKEEKDEQAPTLIDTEMKETEFESAKNGEAEETQVQPLLSQLADFTYVGSAFNTYIIIEHEDSLYFVDQHAAHERHMYDKLMREQKTVSQPLLVGEVVMVSHAQEINLISNKDLLYDMGYEFEEFGPLTYKFSAIPFVLGNCNAAELIADVLSELENGTKVVLMRDKLASRSCKLAVKAGAKLTKEEAEQIVKEIIRDGSIPHCPHGRPIAVATSKSDLERGFRRRV